ncbi:MAG TPA: hypothetical protein PKD85_01740 [Saprospiraceae bacterium]|nr:hypothetical protein [Saprospiraceae bacterium]
METWVWIVLIVGIIILLAGVGVGLYFAFRKTPAKTPTDGSTGGTKGGSTSGRGGSTPVKSGTCKTIALGPPGTITGEFSLTPIGAPNSALSITESSTSATPQAIISSDPSKIYAWSLGDYKTKTSTIKNTLIFGGTVEGKFDCNEGILLTSDTAADLPAFVNKPGSLKFQNQFILSWAYSPYGTICDANGTGYCLYYDYGRTNSVVAAPFNQSDKNFYWTVGSPVPTL